MKYLWMFIAMVLIPGTTTPVIAREEASLPAHVSGKIIFEGDNLPPQRLLKTNEDADYCGETVASERLLIDSGSKGIRNGVIALAPKDPLLKPAHSPGHELNVLVNFHCQFAPHVVILKKGDPLYIKNGDPLLHSNHFYKDQKSLFNLALTPGSKPLKKTINEEGVIQVKCDIHDFMEGFILIDPAPWITITREDGSFDFGEIPPGNYVFSVWHETFSKLVTELTFKPGENRYLPLGVKPN